MSRIFVGIIGLMASIVSFLMVQAANYPTDIQFYNIVLLVLAAIVWLVLIFGKFTPTAKQEVHYGDQ